MRKAPNILAFIGNVETDAGAFDVRHGINAVNLEVATDSGRGWNGSTSGFISRWPAATADRRWRRCNCRAKPDQRSAL